MKKQFYFAAAVLALSACTSEEFVGQTDDGKIEEPQEAIAFGGSTAYATRADHTGSEAADLLGGNFVVTAVKGDGTVAGQTEAFDHYNVNYKASTANTTLSNTNDWEYVGQTVNALSGAAAQTIKYWDYSTTQYDFVAVSLGLGTGTTPKTYADLSTIDMSKLGAAVQTDGSAAVYTLTGTAEELASAYIADLQTLYNRDGQSDYKQVVTPKFRRAGAKIRMAFYETVPGYAVGDVEFYAQPWVSAKPGETTNGTASATPTIFSANSIFPASTGDGVMSVYYPTVGWDKKANTDYNKAHVVYKAATSTTMNTTKTFGALAYSSTKDLAETKHTGNTSDDVFLGRTSATATYAGDLSADNAYYTVIPQGAGDNIQIRIKYTLYPTDGGKGKIVVDNACAVVPAQYNNWQPNYAYTYIFKISDATNGSTGVDGDGNIVEGLTPITFDAVVVDTEDGNQETITSVATPSITTYQKGKVVTANDEYTAGEIYATVMDAGTATATGITLYVAAPKAGAPAGTTVSEATAELAYTQGKTDPSTDLYDKTNITLTQVYGGAAVSAVPGVDGNDITVPAYKWTATAGTTYVLRYDNGTKTAYKVVKVQ